MKEDGKKTKNDPETANFRNKACQGVFLRENLEIPSINTPQTENKVDEIKIKLVGTKKWITKLKDKEPVPNAVNPRVLRVCYRKYTKINRNQRAATRLEKKKSNITPIYKKRKQNKYSVDQII